MKTVAITGSNGFVGTNLKKHFSLKGYEVIGINREDLKDIPKLTKIMEQANIVINLAGANIINRWSESYKKLLYSSRIDTTKALIEAIKNAKIKPETLISTSAVGIYDNKTCYDETTTSYSDDFLSGVCKDWEQEALRASEYGVRTAIFRFGIVLGEGGGALEKMVLPFKLGVGGTIGDGSQYFSFIHIKDLVQAYNFVCENSNLEGVFNLCAPIHTTNKGLTKALGKTLHRPTLLPVPQFALSIIFSEGSKVLTDGQCAIPQRLLDSGFEFQFKSIEETIEDILG